MTGQMNLSFEFPQRRFVVNEIMFGKIEKVVVIFVLSSRSVAVVMLVDSFASCCDGVFDFVVPFQFHEEDENLEKFAKVSRKQVPQFEFIISSTSISIDCLFINQMSF